LTVFVVYKCILLPNIIVWITCVEWYSNIQNREAKMQSMIYALKYLYSLRPSETVDLWVYKKICLCSCLRRWQPPITQYL